MNINRENRVGFFAAEMLLKGTTLFLYKKEGE